MAENYIFKYSYKEKKIEETTVDFEDLQDKFISAFGLDNNIKSDLKFFIKGKEISNEDEIMDIIKEDDIIEVKNLKEEEEASPTAITLKDDLKIKEDNQKNIEIQEKNNISKYDLEEMTKNLKSFILEKFEENNQNFQKIVNEINQNILNIESTIKELNDENKDFKSTTIQNLNKIIELVEQKPSLKDSFRSILSDSSQNNEDSNSLKNNIKKLKEIIKKNTKEKNDLKKQLENNLKGNDNNLEEVEKIKKENNNLLLKNKSLEEKITSLKEKIKRLEENNKTKKKIDQSKNNEKVNASLNKTANDKGSLDNQENNMPVSKINPKKYICNLKENMMTNSFSYEEIEKNKNIIIKLTLTNDGEEEIPPGCEIKLKKSLKGLSLEKYKTKNPIKSFQEVQIQVICNIDLNLISLNTEIPISFGIFHNEKDISKNSNFELNIKIEKEQNNFKEEENGNNNITLEEDDYKNLFDYIEEIYCIGTLGENLDSFKKRLSLLLKEKKEKYNDIKEKTDYLENLKEDLEEAFQNI